MQVLWVVVWVVTATKFWADPHRWTVDAADGTIRRMGINKLPNGKYRAEIWVPGTNGSKGKIIKGPSQALRRDAADDEIAMKLGLKEQAEVAASEAAVAGLGLDPSMTVDRWITAWMPKQKWASGTRSEYERGYGKVSDSFKNLLLSQVNPRNYKAAVYQVEPHGARRKAHQVFGKSFKEAVEDGYMVSSPTTVVSVPMPKPPEIVPPTTKEVKLIIAKASTDAWKVFFRVAAATGLRRGEICGLQWRDLDEGHLSVRRVVWYDPKKGTHGIDVPKTPQSKRTISVDQATMAAIHTLPKTSKFVFAGDHFTSPVEPGAGYILPASASQAFTRAVEAVEWEDKPDVMPSLHDLRHYHASVLIASGVDIVAVSRRLGHASVTTTLNRYGHLMKGRDDGAAGVIASEFG